MAATIHELKPALAAPAAGAAEHSARQELIARLCEMTEALQAGDDALFGERLQNLMRRREQGLFLRIERITDQLQRAFASLDADQRWTGINAELPDTSARLAHVTALTERAAHRTLDLVELSQGALRQAAQTVKNLAPLRAQLLMSSAQPQALVIVECTLQRCENELGQAHGQLRGHLSELAQAQEYQDLTGQLLKRVGGVVREVECGLAALLGERPRIQGSSAAAAKGLEGPAVPGVGSGQVDQADADALLAMFM